MTAPLWTSSHAQSLPLPLPSPLSFRSPPLCLSVLFRLLVPFTFPSAFPSSSRRLSVTFPFPSLRRFLALPRAPSPPTRRARVRIPKLHDDGALRTRRPIRSMRQAGADVWPKILRVAERKPARMDYLNRKLSRESRPIEAQPISLMSRSISARMRPSARSTPAWPAAASG